MCRQLAILLAAFVLGTPAVFAQGPLGRLLDGNSSGNLSRLPNDQVEGTIWEYRGKLKDETRQAKLKEEEQAAAAKAADKQQKRPLPPLGLPGGKAKEEEAEQKVTEIKGQFRTEGDAIFAVNRRVSLPSRSEVERDRKKLLAGQLDEIKLPGRSSPKRIGQYHRLKSGKLKLEFDDKASLHGIMVVQKRKKTSDVWIGEYREMDGKTLLRKWTIEIRGIED